MLGGRNIDSIDSYRGHMFDVKPPRFFLKVYSLIDVQDILGEEVRRKANLPGMIYG